MSFVTFWHQYILDVQTPKTMPGIRGIMSGARSMRLGRTTGSNLSESSKQNIQQSHSDPLVIRRVNTDDSSVFSGVASIHTILDDDENKSVKSVRFEDQVPPVIKNSGGHKVTKRILKQRDSLGIVRIASSKSIEENEAHVELYGDEHSSFSKGDQDRYLGQERALSPALSYGFGSSTSCASSVNEFVRPKGTVRLLSNIQMIEIKSSQDEEEDQTIEPSTPDGAEGIKSILQQFGQELDEGLSRIHDEGYADLENQQLHKTLSSEKHYDASSQEAKLLQITLHQLQKEMSVLRENNDQFLSEIEQTTEEHESEMKLQDERMKQKIQELKLMHQEEMEALIQEKDAAVAEAGLQAARHAESGRKQIATLQKQIAKLKEHMKMAMRQAVEKAVITTKRQKEQEAISRLSALRSSYESKLEKLKSENEESLKAAIDEAVIKVAKQIIEGQEPAGLDNETLELLSKQREIIKHENRTLLALQSVKENIAKHYPEQIKELHAKSRPNTMVLLFSNQDESASEKILREVVEAFAFVLENLEAQPPPPEPVPCTPEKETYAQAKKDFMEKHRLGLEFMKSQAEAAKNRSKNAEIKIVQLEQDLKLMTREKRMIQERFRRESESHRIEVQRLRSDIEKQKEELMQEITGNDTNSVNRLDVTEMETAERSSDDFSLDMKLPLSDSCDEIESQRSPPISPLHGLRISEDPQQIDVPGRRVATEDSVDQPQDDDDSGDRIVSQKQGGNQGGKLSKLKSFAILRGFKPTGATKANTDNSKVYRQGNSENEEDSSNSQRSSHRSASKIRGFLDAMTGVDSSRDDGSVSSLRTYTGVDTVQEQTKSTQPSTIANADSGDGDQDVPSDEKQSRKKKNPLGMFTNRRKQSLSPETVAKSDPQQRASETEGSESFDDDDKAAATKATSAADSGSTRQQRSPLPGFDSLKQGKNDVSLPVVVNGRKPALPEWTTDIETTSERLVSPQFAHPIPGLPSAVDLQRNAANKADDDAWDDEAESSMYSRPPLPAENKSHTDGISMITEEEEEEQHGSFVCGLRSTPKQQTATGKDLYSSPAQMRKMPPLISDDESRDEFEDRYQSFEPSVSVSSVPALVSRRTFEDSGSVDDQSNLSASTPVVVQGRAVVSRKAKLQALSRRTDTSESNSEATTTITAHTFRSSFSTDPSKVRDLVRNSPSLPMGASSKKATALATLKARRARRGEV